VADKLTPERRSANMRRIKSRGTAPEAAVSAILRRLRFSFAAHAFDLPGKPDFVLRRRRTAIFVHGCFWHLHPARDCADARRPKSNRGYWGLKLAGNVRRDKRNARKLRALGWRVLTVWECRTKDETALVKRLRAALRL
jgi:DNA mismatch endonuclease (patch repair protein)